MLEGESMRVKVRRTSTGGEGERETKRSEEREEEHA